MIFNGSLSALTRKSIFAIFLAFASLAHAELSGSVVAILDGDTIDVLVDRNPVRVRLAQIDAPEKRQAFGTCRIPDDCIDPKRYPLFMARAVLQELIESLQSTLGVKPC